MNRSRTALAAAAALAVLLSLPAAAFADSDDRPVPEAARIAITTALEAQGYQVFTIETERGGYEVKAARDGRLWELRLDADHQVIRAELED